MERSSFFNAELIDEQYDRTYNAEDFARYFASFIKSGVYALQANNLQVVSTNGDMALQVRSGKAWINGYFYENTEDLSVSVDNADGTHNRIDRVVVQLDLANRHIITMIKKGSPSSRPSAPTLQRDSNIYELALADISVKAGAIKINQSDITDCRYDNKLCGIVSGVVDQIDTTNLFAQFEDAFERWFDDVRNTLGTDSAGNLLNKINEIISKLSEKLSVAGGTVKGDLTINGRLRTKDGIDVGNKKLYNVQAIQNDGKEMIGDDFLGNTHINATGNAVRIGYGSNTKQIIAHKPLYQYASYLILDNLNVRAQRQEFGLTKEKVDELMNVNQEVRWLTDNRLYESVDSDLAVNTNHVISQLIDTVLSLRKEIEELKKQ